VDLEEAKRAIQRLSPDGLCLGRLLDLKGTAPDVARGVIGAVTNALLGGGVLVRIASAAIEALAGKSLRQLLVKRGVVKNEAVECIKDIVNSAREASRYIDDEGLRGVVEEVASKWGWDVDTFRRFVKTAAGKTVTESEVRKMIEEALEKIKEELGKVRERVSGQLAGVEVFFINDFENGSAYPTVRLVNGELMVLGEYGYHEVVRTGSFGALASEVGRRLGAGSLVVLTGPKGVGKSTLASVTIWNLLRSGEVGMVLRIKEPPEGEVVERFRSFIENFLVRDWEYFGNLVILYDPTGVYGQVEGVEAPSKLETTVRNVFGAVMKAQENVRSILGREPSARVGVLIILPTDLYNALSNDVKGKLESYRLDASLNDVEFLAKLIMEYTRTSDKPSGCKISDEELSKLAGELAEFDSGHALIARLAGEELARSNCNVGEVEKLIYNAKGKARVFIIQYINKLFKVDKDPNVAEALVEIFALRRPFVNITMPGVPILTPGIVELVGKERGANLLRSAEGGELRSWLVIRQHDLIEEAIGKLLDCVGDEGEECEVLGDASKPWKTIEVKVIESLRKVSNEVKDRDRAVKYFASKYGEKLTDALKVFSNCWKRAALIIGHALAGIPTVPRPEDLSVFLPEDLRKSVVESLGDALKRCGVDEYLLVGNVIPPLIWYLTYTRALAEAFIDKYNEVIAEVRRVFGIARGRSGFHPSEEFYGLGLASIIAKAAELGRDVKPSDADTALHIATSAIQYVTSPDLIRPILRALEPLRDKAPQRYIEPLASALSIENLDSGTVRYILKKLSEILDNYGDVVKGHAWFLVHAIIAYTDLIGKHLDHFSDEEVKDMVRKIADLLNKLGKLSPSLGVIAGAYALNPALMLNTDVVDKASEVLEELNDMRKRVQELMRDEEFRSYVESRFVKADEEAVKEAILDAASHFKQTLAIYRLDNDELDKAEELFKEVAKEYREIAYENDLVDCFWALRVDAIKGSLAGDKLVDGFRQLYEETFNEEHFEYTARYLSIASHVLGGYLVSLALTGDHETISKLLEEHWWVLNADGLFSVITRLMLNALLGHRVELSGKLEGKLSVNPEELIDTFGSYMYSEFLPALRVAFRMVGLEDGYEECKSKRRDCRGAVLAAADDSDAIWWLRWELIYNFNERISEKEKSGWLRKLGFDANVLISEFEKLVNGLDGKFLAQLIAPANSIAQFVLMLRALINGDERLAKAHALMGAVNVGGKLPTRLYLEAYKACCDLESEGFRRAVAKLFLYHI